MAVSISSTSKTILWKWENLSSNINSNKVILPQAGITFHNSVNMPTKIVTIKTSALFFVSAVAIGGVQIKRLELADTDAIVISWPKTDV